MHSIFSWIDYIVQNSKHVKIDFQQIDKLLPQIAAFHLESSYPNELIFPSKLSDEQSINLLFFIYSLNFCFWQKPKWLIPYKDKIFSWTYWVIASFLKAIDKWFELYNPMFILKLSEKEFKDVFVWESDIIIPLFEERVNILRNNSEILLKSYEWSFYNFLLQNDFDLLKLLLWLSQNFINFNDTSLYEWCSVNFFKLWQVLLAEINEYLKFSAKWLKNMNILIWWADYKIPRFLRNLWILKYERELSDIVDNWFNVEKWSVFEIEIRSNACKVIDLISEKIVVKSNMEISNIIWLLSKTDNSKTFHHQTVTTFY